MKELGWMLSCVQVTLYGHNTGPNSSAPLLVHVPVLELVPAPVPELVLNLYTKVHIDNTGPNSSAPVPGSCPLQARTP